MKKILLVLLGLSVLLFGCLGTGTTSNASIAPTPAANDATIAPTPAPTTQPAVQQRQIPQIALCVIRQPGVDEYIAFDVAKNRYVYEGRVNNTLVAEMVYSGNQLYFRLIPAFGGCNWAQFKEQADFNSVQSLGGIATLPYGELANRVPVDACISAPLIEKVFNTPTDNVCHIKTVLPKGLAGKK
ncbi:hypothetical protein HZC09_06390 [Candidatus Micrarchaeota archaeon]|nr:hypothetical protein [Candidatus Micrarchaeota archaeon]